MRVCSGLNGMEVDKYYYQQFSREKKLRSAQQKDVPIQLI